MIEPGPDHPIAIAPTGKRVRVVFADRVIARSTRALTLQEIGHAPVVYLPRADVDMSALARTTHASYCPYKGNASYFTIAVVGRASQNAAWSYEQPYPAVAAIKEFVAFYPNRIDRIEES
jgi:uncharacterized protein (DUF427 family)